MDTSARRPYKWVAGILLLLIIVGIYHYFFSAPTTNTGSTTIHIAEGESVRDVSLQLKDDGVIRYAYILRGFIDFFKSDKQIARGDYLFEKGLPVYQIAWQIASSRHNVAPIKITLKEGITNNQIAALLSSQLSVFDSNTFLEDPQVKQGYLFPDTYFFFPLTTTDEVITAITSDFDKRITPLKSDIALSGKTESSIIVMASLIEKEAQGKDDASVIAGILWKRIALGMPLQVDAAPLTYTQKGLPAQAIDNPGLVSINAALHPIDSAYLYYLHDKNGMVHYATTFAEHKDNISRYLK